MTLTNIANFTISGNTCTIIDDFTQSAVYESTKITITSAVKYYYNGVLQYTSQTYTAGDYYPYLGVRSEPGDQWTFSTGSDSIGDFIQWRFDFTPDQYGKHAGFNHDTALEADDMSGAMVVSGNGEGVFAQVRENDAPKFVPDPKPVVESGDIFRVYYTAAAPAGGSNITFPQIPQPKSIKNSAFKS